MALFNTIFASLSATSPFKQGCLPMICVRHKRPPDIVDKNIVHHINHSVPKIPLSKK